MKDEICENYKYTIFTLVHTLIKSELNLLCVMVCIQQCSQHEVWRKISEWVNVNCKKIKIALRKFNLQLYVVNV